MAGIFYRVSRHWPVRRQRRISLEPKKSHVSQVILEGHDGYQIVRLVPLINHTCTYIHGSMMKIVDARALINVSQGCIPGILF